MHKYIYTYIYAVCEYDLFLVFYMIVQEITCWKRFEQNAYCVYNMYRYYIMRINQWYTQSCLFPLEYNEPSKCHVYKLREVTHCWKTQQAEWPLPDNWWKGLAMYSSARSCREKLYCTQKVCLISTILTASGHTISVKRSLEKKINTIRFPCQLPSSQMLPRFEKLQSSTVPFLERKPTNRPIISSCCPWSQNPPLYMHLTLFFLAWFWWFVSERNDFIWVFMGVLSFLFMICFSGSQDPKIHHYTEEVHRTAV